MSRSRINERYVLFHGPQQHGRPGTRYYANNGTITKIKCDAAKFLTPEEAREFAERHDIELHDVMRYIGLEDFSESELSR